MLPRDPSNTTSSKSVTSKGPAQGLSTPIQFLKGVGPKLGFILGGRGIETVGDLLTFFPRAYEDRTKILTVNQLKDGQLVNVSVEVLKLRRIPLRKSGRMMVEVQCKDSTGVLNLKWFHFPRGMEARFLPGTEIMVTGTVKAFMGRPEILHPEISWSLQSQETNTGRVVPVYTEIEGVPSRTFRKILWEALQRNTQLIAEDLPQQYVQKHQLPTKKESIHSIHFPEEDEVEALVAFRSPGHQRLIYEEFFKFEYLVLRKRLNMERRFATPFGEKGGSAEAKALEKVIPFSLTGDQKKAIAEILKDLGGDHPMNRLIQGDVGSGKTLVAFLTSAAVIAEGGQVALMVPTEILAEQHYKNAVKFFGGRLPAALLTGKTPASERAVLQQKLANGQPMILIGTHALIEEPVQFKNLVYVMIDEQHRFGVEQRRILKTKGARKDGTRVLLPHTLILTATPIPRTLALTAYGDLHISTIKEMPPGRTPVKTHVVTPQKMGPAYNKIRQELKAGHQAYFIYPLIHEKEEDEDEKPKAVPAVQLKSAVAEAERLQKEVFPEFRVGLLHGQLRPDEKAEVMDRFKRKELDILVSTTVIEVGVDVANATVMVIEHAERFGLSQLHQLRGRVGRSNLESFCFLFTKSQLSEISTQRLGVLEQTHDGFKIAEADLEIRGPGEFLGTRQSGDLPFRMANLVRDRDWLLKAREDAEELLNTDSNLERPSNQELRRYFEREGKIQFERLGTS